MSYFSTGAQSTANTSNANASPRRKISTDLSRIKNFPSTLSLRKPEPESSNTAPGPGAFSRIRNFGQAHLRNERSDRNLAASYDSPHTASAVDHSNANTPPMTTGKSDSSLDSKMFRRRSRLLDAFRPSRKPQPSFEVIRKPPNHSTTSFQSSGPATSTRVELNRNSSRMSAMSSDLPEAPPRISLTVPRPASSASQVDGSAFVASFENISSRSPYPPSTSATRKFGSAKGGQLGRRISDTIPGPISNPTSRAQSPSFGSQPDSQQRASFSLHSFRNVRSASDASRTDDGGHSRVHSVISVDEFTTPREELPEPSLALPEEPAAPVSAPPIVDSLPTPTSPTVDDTTIDASHARVVGSPSPITAAAATGNAPKPASMSAARFRQASRQRSESGNIPGLDSTSAQHTGSSTARPVRSRTPSQDLAMMEAIIAQNGKRISRPVSAADDRRNSIDPSIGSAVTSAPAPVSATAATNRANAASVAPSRKRGYFIVVEGLDRAGKSTQVERLAKALGAEAIKFPERTTAIGQMINSYLAQTSDLDDKAIHLLFSANRWECVTSIQKTLEQGTNIVCDRYAFSGIAYSVSKGLAYDWCRNPDVGLPLPDLTLFLDLDATTAAARGGYGEERYEKLEFQAKVREAFDRVSDDVKAHGGRWATVNAGKTLEEVTDEIQRTVQRAISSMDRVGAPLGKLFVSQRPANDRASSSNELVPPTVSARPDLKRSSYASDRSAISNRSVDASRPPIGTPNGSTAFPSVRPAGSPLSYSEQLAAVRAAAAGTLSGLFGGSSTTPDALAKPLEPEGPAATNSLRGYGADSARVLANYQDDGTGRRPTLIDVIGQLESHNGGDGQIGKESHRRSMSAAPDGLPSPSEGFTSNFALSGRPRRSTDQSRPAGSAGPMKTVSTAVVADTPALRDVPLIVPSPQRASEAVTVNDLTPSPEIGQADSSPLSSTTRPHLEPADRRRHGNGSRLSVQSGQAETASMRSSPVAAAPSPRLSSPSSRPPSASATPLPRGSTSSPMTNVAELASPQAAHAAPSTNPAAHLSAQQLAALNMQQGQAEFQEQYMRNYMAMMANPMLAQQAHYQMMLQRHQQQYYGRAASAIGATSGPSIMPGSAAGMGANGKSSGNGNGAASGATGPPTAAFMQPGTGYGFQPNVAASEVGYAGQMQSQSQSQRERRRSHQRTLSSGSFIDPASLNRSTPNVSGVPSQQHASAAAQNAQMQMQQPMLSMMMAAPPQTSVTAPSSPTMAPQHFYAQAQPQMAFHPSMFSSASGVHAQPFPIYGPGSFARPFYSAAQSELAVSAQSPPDRTASAAAMRTRRSMDKKVSFQELRPAKS
ncbi:hypothetical protein BCV70DRAFT_200306 [Testicularia cyperi]|uniref:Thymidylate kinase n=1 Tax=Testicularia cyperi TaxID=1882483 RepID=A0A317XPY5_9BASI|nr:hypothetical protein BCV70DRAFT_200306 [Testicularia cyperi]